MASPSIIRLGLFTATVDHGLIVPSVEEQHSDGYRIHFYLYGDRIHCVEHDYSRNWQDVALEEMEAFYG